MSPHPNFTFYPSFCTQNVFHVSPNCFFILSQQVWTNCLSVFITSKVHHFLQIAPHRLVWLSDKTVRHGFNCSWFVLLVFFGWVGGWGGLVTACHYWTRVQGKVEYTVGAFLFWPRLCSLWGYLIIQSAVSLRFLMQKWNRVSEDIFCFVSIQVGHLPCGISMNDQRYF